MACVEGEQRPHQRIVELDRQFIIDASVRDLALEMVDERVPVMQSERRVWVLYSADEYSDGPRSRLEPPHHPVMSPIETLSALHPDLIIMEWTGPMTSSDERLQLYGQQVGRAVIPVPATSTG